MIMAAVQTSTMDMGTRIITDEDKKLDFFFG